MTISYEVLLNIAFWLGIGFLVVTWVWMWKRLNKASQIANVLAASYLTVVEMGILVNKIINGESWLYTFFLCCLWLANVAYKAILEIRRQ